MKRSLSFVQTRMTLGEYPVQKKPQIDYNRFVYINSEKAKKQKHTIFHSPYKGGKRNPNYSNPSFMSSQIFYPRDYSANQHSKSKPKVGLIQNKNDVIQQQQYKSRMMRKSCSGAFLNKDLKLQKKREQKNDQINLQKSIEKVPSQQKINFQILRKIQNSKQLKQQIQLLRKSPPKNKYLKSYQDQNPIYLQDRSSLMNRMIKKQTSKHQLVDQMNKAIKRKQQQKYQKQNQRKTDKAYLDKQAQRFYAGVKSSSQYQRQRAKLLSELLLEQILQKS